MKNLKLKSARAALDLSQQQLAEKVGVSRQTINAIEKGDYNPTIKLCVAICRVLGKTLDDLFWDEKQQAHILIYEENTMIPNDPMILLSYINTKLRDEYKSLDLLCDDLQIDRAELESKLSGIDYTYNPELNRFV